MDIIKKYQWADTSKGVRRVNSLIYDKEVAAKLTEYYNTPLDEKAENLFMNKYELLSKLQDSPPETEGALYRELLSYSPCITDEGNSYKSKARKVDPNKGDSMEVAYKEGAVEKPLTKKQQEARDKADKAKNLTRNTAHEKGNAILREAYLDSNKVLDINVFKAACPENYMEEVLIYLVAEYIQQSLRAMVRELGLMDEADITDIPPSLDHYNGWLGTVNHGAIKDIINSYTRYDKLQVTLMLTSINSRIYNRYLAGVKSSDTGHLDIKGIIPTVDSLKQESASFSVKKGVCNLHYHTQFTEGVMQKPIHEDEWLDLYDAIHPSRTKQIIKSMGINTMNYQSITSIVEAIYVVTGEQPITVDLKAGVLMVIKEMLVTGENPLTHYTPEQLEQYRMHAKYYQMVMSNAQKAGLSTEQLQVCENMVVDQIMIDMDKGVSGVSLYDNPSIVYFGHRLLTTETPMHNLISPMLEDRVSKEDYDLVAPAHERIKAKRLSKYNKVFKNSKASRELYAIQLSTIIINQLTVPDRVANYELYREVGAIMVNELMLGDNSLTDWEKVKEHLT